MICSDDFCFLMGLFARPSFWADTCATRFEYWRLPWPAKRLCVRWTNFRYGGELQRRNTSKRAINNKCKRGFELKDTSWKAIAVIYWRRLDLNIQFERGSLSMTNADWNRAIRNISRWLTGAFRRYSGSLSTILVVLIKLFSFASIFFIYPLVQLPIPLLLRRLQKSDGSLWQKIQWTRAIQAFSIHKNRANKLDNIKEH